MAAARAVAGTATEPALSARLDVLTAHVALDQADVTAAEAHALDGRGHGHRAARGRLRPLIVLGRLARTTDPGRATTCFEEAARLAEEAGLGSWHLRARHELAVAAWTNGDTSALVQTRTVAARYGALVTMAVMDLSLADIALTNFDRRGCLEAARPAPRRAAATPSPPSRWRTCGSRARTPSPATTRRCGPRSATPSPPTPRTPASWPTCTAGCW